MIAIVDYGAGNVASVLKALHHLGAEAVVTADPAVLGAAAHVVFPGQGHFGQAMARLHATGLDAVLQDVLARGVPFTGICLGLQLLFEGSDEAPGVAGLGYFRGRCVSFQPPNKTPQIGWNDLRVHRQQAKAESESSSPLDASFDGQHVYFVHSYHAVATEPEFVVATADYGGSFCAAVQRGPVFAAQFHPEKSGEVGLRLLRNCIDRNPPVGQGTSRC